MGHSVSETRATGKSAHLNSVQAQINNEQIGLLYQQLPSSMAASLAVAIILAVALWGHVPNTSIIAWVAALGLLSTGRFVLSYAFRNKQADGQDMRLWYVYFLMGSIASGIIWGSAGVFLMPEKSLGHQVLVIFILGGIMAGASQSLSAILMAYISFCIPAIIPIFVWLLLQDTPVHLSMALLILFFAFMLLVISRHLNHALIESFRLRFENIDLIANLEKEVSARKKTEGTLRGHNTILEMLATQPSLTDVLNAINQTVEDETPGAKSSILLLDEEGKHLLSGSAPSLPAEYNNAINGVAIGPKVGSCGTSAYRNEMVIVEDISSDPLWADYKDIALAHKLRACWSIPIRDSQKRVIGTFALYYETSRKPRQAEIRGLKDAANLADIAIEHCQSQEKLNKMAHFDALTGLPNRAMFMDRLKQVIAQARRRRQQLALLFIDLNKFKLINDTLGHEAGDVALQETAKRLISCVREEDTAARLGGDEFTIILTEIHSREDASLVSKKVIDALGQDIELEGQKYFVGGSIGISLYPEDGEDADSLLGKADTAMYQAKEKGGDTYIFYSKIK